MEPFHWSIIHDPAFVGRLPIPNEANRDDAIQDACVKLLTYGKPITSPLFRATTINCHKDRVKAERRRHDRERKSAGFSDQSNEAYDAEARPRRANIRPDNKPQSYTQDPSANIERREKRAAIKRAVRAAGLSRDHRCALWVWFRGCMGDFARRRRIPQATVRVWAKRARDALPRHLQAEGLGPD